MPGRGEVVTHLSLLNSHQLYSEVQKKPTSFWGLVKASAQLWFHPEATTHLAKQNFLKHLSSCLCKNQSSDAIRQCEKSQLCWSHSFES